MARRAGSVINGPGSSGGPVVEQAARATTNCIATSDVEMLDEDKVFGFKVTLKGVKMGLIITR
eukprot:11243371-Alexandrium_andersonii.AAC.1